MGPVRGHRWGEEPAPSGGRLPGLEGLAQEGARAAGADSNSFAWLAVASEVRSTSVFISWPTDGPGLIFLDSVRLGAAVNPYGAQV